MKLDKIAGTRMDEYYTPEYAITPLVKHLRRAGFKTVWCPFDAERSLYVSVLKSEGFNVINTHISTGGDFFEMATPECDVIISNPPYSKKNEVFESLFKRKKPFAMLVGGSGIFESEKRYSLFSSNSTQVAFFDKRITYLYSYDDERPTSRPPFGSVYVASGVFPSDLWFERLFIPEKDRDIRSRRAKR